MNYTIAYRGGVFQFDFDLDSTVSIGLHEYTYQPQKNEQISDLPDAVTWYNEYGIHSPGKYIFTTTMKEPALLIPDTVTY